MTGTYVRNVMTLIIPIFTHFFVVFQFTGLLGSHFDSQFTRNTRPSGGVVHNNPLGRSGELKNARSSNLTNSSTASITRTDSREFARTAHREFVRRDAASSVAGMAGKSENPSPGWVQCGSPVARLKTRQSNSLVLYKCRFDGVIGDRRYSIGGIGTHDALEARNGLSLFL